MKQQKIACFGYTIYKYSINANERISFASHKGKQFNCQTCGEAFFKETSLIRHKETVHGLDIN